MRCCLATVVLVASSVALAEETELVPLGDLPARLIAVHPGDGADGVSPETALRMRFDGAIDPDAFTLSWDRGGFLDVGDFSYQPVKRELTVPVRLLAGQEHRVRLGDRIRQALRGADGHPVVSGAWGFSSAEDVDRPTAARASLVSVTPAPGSKVPRVTWIRMRFDHAVDVGAIRLELTDPKEPESTRRFPSPRVQAMPLVEVDKSRKGVTLPVVFPAGWEGDLRVTIGGAEPFTVAYSTTGDLVDWDDDAFATTPETDAEVRSIVERARAARRDLHSAVVESRTRSLARATPNQVQPFQRVRFTRGEFRFQGDQQYVGDVSGWMGIPFAIGSDGDSCWFLFERRGRDGNKRLELTRCNPDQIDDAQVSIADAFAAGRLDLDQVMEERRLRLVGPQACAGRDCQVIRSWEIRGLGSSDRVGFSATDWWIDAESYLPRRVVKHLSGGFRQVTDLHYSRLNEPAPKSAFAPPRAEAASRVELGPLGEGYSTRFLKVSDGADGRVSARWGKQGSRGKSSSGLN